MWAFLMLVALFLAGSRAEAASIDTFNCGAAVHYVPGVGSSQFVETGLPCVMGGSRRIGGGSLVQPYDFEPGVGFSAAAGPNWDLGFTPFAEYLPSGVDVTALGDRFRLTFSSAAPSSLSGVAPFVRVRVNEQANAVISLDGGPGDYELLFSDFTSVVPGDFQNVTKIVVQITLSDPVAAFTLSAFSVVPEPSALWLLSLGLAAVIPSGRTRAFARRLMKGSVP